jgi:midasin
VHFVGHLNCYIRDMFDLTDSLDFDEGVFQTYLTIGRSITDHVVEFSAIRSLSEKLNSELSAFNASWQLCTGLSMEILWQLFKPPLAKNLEQLESRARAKELANRFDAIKWMTGATIRDLDLLRWSIINLHDTIDSSEVEVGERLNV